MSLNKTKIALAVATTLASLSAFAADYTVNNPTGTTGYYVGLYNPDAEINESVTITQGEQPNDMVRTYGFWVKGADQKGIINGDLNVSVNPTGNIYSWGIYAQDGATIKVNGDTTLNAGGNCLETYGGAVYGDGAVLDLSAGKTTISMTSSASRFIRAAKVEETGALIIGKTDVAMNVSGYVQGTNNSNNRYVHGFYVAKGTLDAKDDVSIAITGFNETGELVDLGSERYGTRIRGINIEGSGYNSDVTFDKNLAISLNAKTEEIIGIFTTTDNQATEELHSRLSIGGNLSVDIDGDAQKIYGVESQGEASINAKNIGITINSHNSDAYVYGLAAISTKPDFEGVSGITVNDSVSIFLMGSGKLHALEALGTQSERQTGISIAGLTQINVLSTEGEGIGLKLDGGSKVVLNDLKANIISNSTDENAKSIGASALDNSSIIINGDAEIEAKGKNATGIQLEKSSLSLGGKTLVKGDGIGIKADAYAEIILNKDAVLSTNSMQSVGKTSMAEGSQLEVTGSKDGRSELGAIDATKGTVSVGAGIYSISTFSGDDNSLVLNDLANTMGVGITTKTGSLNIVANGTSNDQYANAQEAADALLDAVHIQNDQAKDQNKVEVQIGDVNDGLSATLTEDGKLNNVSVTKNDKLDAFGSVTALSALTLRHEMNSLSKRMGELRDAPAGVGAWVRGYGSEMEYGAQNIKAKNNSIQMGSDYTVGDWKVGAAFTYTDGESSYDNGSADNKGYGVAMYGTWFVPCGAYVDLMAKYNRLDNDFALNGMDGSYDANAYGVSAETGYRFNFMDGGVYVEPQVGIAYSRMTGETFTAANGVTVEQDDYDSLIGRVGVRTGFKFPKDKGTIYARVSGVYDFQGEVNGTATKGQAFNTIEEDLGGAWLEVGVGANFNWTKDTYTYIDFERTNGGEVKENYRWNIGVRHTF